MREVRLVVIENSEFEKQDISTIFEIIGIPDIQDFIR